VTRHVTLAKFDSQIASHSQTYSGTGTVESVSNFTLAGWCLWGAVGWARAGGGG